MAGFHSKLRAFYTIFIHSQWTRQVREQTGEAPALCPQGSRHSAAAHGPAVPPQDVLSAAICGPWYLLQTAKGGMAKRTYVQCRQMIFMV